MKADSEEDEGITTEEIVEEGQGDDLKRRKSSSRPAQRQKKTAAPARPVQHKYAALFMSGSGAGTGARKQEKQIPPMVQLARAIKCLDVFGRNDPERAAFYAKKHYDDTAMEREFIMCFRNSC